LGVGVGDGYSFLVTVNTKKADFGNGSTIGQNINFLRTEFHVGSPGAWNCEKTLAWGWIFLPKYKKADFGDGRIGQIINFLRTEFHGLPRHMEL
jgi:hypothetical protein